jgi:hypothetical protein
MSIIALITWICAAACGLYLVSVWLIEYDREFQSVAATRLPPAVLASHVTLAGGGLVVWVAYLADGSASLAKVAILALLLAATLGTFMAIRWVGVYREFREIRRTEGRAQADWPAASAPGTPRPQGGWQLATAGRIEVSTRPVSLGPPERNFPLPVVIWHGVFAVATLTIVLLNVLNVGGS